MLSLPIPSHPDHATEGYAALWLGALMAATGQLRDTLPPEMGGLARRYCSAHPPEVKA